MKLSACLIVKNEEKNLAQTLPTLSQGVDEVIVVDTGSSDGTVALAKKFGAKVYHFAWIDDFSAARNESLKYATGDWILWIDADEFISLEDLRALRENLEKGTSSAYYLPIYECPYGETVGSTFYFRLKVFRSGCGFHFERPFNEQVYKENGELLETSAFLPSIKICHWGRFLAPETIKNKKERNFRILEKVLKENTRDAYYHLLLANNYLEVGKTEKAKEAYQKTIDLKQEPVASLARIRKAKILIEQNQYEEAYQLLKVAASQQGWNAEIYNLIAVIYLSINNLEKAKEVLEYARKLEVPKTNLFGVDITQFGYFPNFLLGNTYLLLGDKGKALAAFETAYGYQKDERLRDKIDNLRREVQLND